MVAGINQTHSATGVTPKQDARYRHQHRFWLNLNNYDDNWLDRQIKTLKRDRAYSRAVRDGLRLFLDLKAGRTVVLFELFPMLKQTIKAEIQEEMLVTLLAGQPLPAPAGQRPKPLGKVIPMTPPPADDLPALVMTKAASDGKAASGNFLSSCANLQS